MSQSVPSGESCTRNSSGNEEPQNIRTAQRWEIGICVEQSTHMHVSLWSQICMYTRLIAPRRGKPKAHAYQQPGWQANGRFIETTPRPYRSPSEGACMRLCNPAYAIDRTQGKAAHIGSGSEAGGGAYLQAYCDPLRLMKK